MNARFLFPYNPILAIICALFVTGTILLADSNPAENSYVNHQPRTFHQMREFITPDDPAIVQALTNALGGYNNASNGEHPEATVKFDKIREWGSTNIEYASDDTTYGIIDYWQLPTETLVLRTGDCEDYAILLVSLLRAHGVPDDQVYVAVGYDLNDNWHAYVIERYYNGVWRILNAESAKEDSLVESLDGQTYNIAYCFNDKIGFRGLPSYPADYVVPEINPTPTVSVPSYDWVRLHGVKTTGWFEGDINLINPSLDTVKQRMGKLWVPTYLPEGYSLAYTAVNGNWLVYLTYHKTNSIADLYLEIIPGGVDYRYPSGTVEEYMINNNKAYLVRGAWVRTVSGLTYVDTWLGYKSLNLFFKFDDWVIVLRGEWANSWTREELIKIAESLKAYP
jgi:hypothetical protein